MSDTSIYDARIYQEQMATEYLRQQAAEEELNYWKRKREILESEESLALQRAKLGERP